MDAALKNLSRAITLAGARVLLRASDEGALAIAGWTGSAYARLSVTAGGAIVASARQPATGPSTSTSVPATSTSTQVAASNASRYAAIVSNNDGTNTVRIAIGENASGSTLPLRPYEKITLVGTGAINAWNNGSGAVEVSVMDFTY